MAKGLDAMVVDFNMKKYTRLILFFIVVMMGGLSWASKTENMVRHGVYVGMSEGEFLALHPFKSVRNFRHIGNDDWLTYLKSMKDASQELVTYHFQNDQLIQLNTNDRPEIVREYLSEFSFYQDPDIIYKAVKEVL